MPGAYSLAFESLVMLCCPAMANLTGDQATHNSQGEVRHLRHVLGAHMLWAPMLGWPHAQGITYLGHLGVHTCFIAHMLKCPHAQGTHARGTQPWGGKTGPLDAFARPFNNSHEPCLEERLGLLSSPLHALNLFFMHDSEFAHSGPGAGVCGGVPESAEPDAAVSAVSAGHFSAQQCSNGGPMPVLMCTQEFSYPTFEEQFVRLLKQCEARAEDVKKAPPPAPNSRNLDAVKNKVGWGRDSCIVL
eukprot:302962-Pelagomonas_calceolata.AAC.1